MSEHAEHGHEEHHEVHPVKHYTKIYWVLLALLIVSIAGPEIAPHVGHEHLARAIVLITAFGIAVVKAFMVCKNFMHLNVQRRYVLYMLGMMLAFVIMFFSAVAPDVMKHEGQNWSNESAKAAVERGMAAGEVVHHEGGHDAGHGETSHEGGH